MSSRHSGIVHRDKDGMIWFDDVPVRDSKRLRRPVYQGTLWYSTLGVKSADWASLLEDGDVAFGPEPGEISGVSLRCGKGRLRVLDARCWGVTEGDPNRCSSELDLLAMQALSCDLNLRPSAASTAISAYLKGFDGVDGRVQMRQLPARWRGLAHAAMQAGPVSVLKASAPFVAHLDVHRAYLKALYEPLPVYGTLKGQKVGGWFTHDDLRWKKIRHLCGFVEATVHVRGTIGLDLPPLPVRTVLGTIYPTGILRGVWTIGQLVDAEERAEIEIRTVHQFCYAPVLEPVFADLADLFEHLPQPLGKHLYTRFWGKLGSRGGYVGFKSEKVVNNAAPAGGLWWTYSGISNYSGKARPTYRPDLSAMVIAHNQRNVMATARRLAPGSILATHVDAIWTSDIIGANKISAEGGGVGSWRTKKLGPMRLYGFGAYKHGDRLACSGFDRLTRGELTLEKLESFSQSEGLDEGYDRERRSLLRSRDWVDGKDPAFHADADSTPLDIDMTEAGPRTQLSIYDKNWTTGGWHRLSEKMDKEMQAAVDDMNTSIGEEMMVAAK
jgi:hypothetical protein